MNERRRQVFVDPSGRRKRLMRWAAAGLTAGFICFVMALVSGFFTPEMGNGPPPWVSGEQTHPPDGKAKATPGTTPTRRGTAPRPSPPGSTATPTGTLRPPAASTASPAPETSATPTTAPAATGNAPVDAGTPAHGRPSDGPTHRADPTPPAWGRGQGG